MLSSLSLGSIDNLEKLPINSLNNICDQVRQALLHVYLPRLCLNCQPAFSEAFRRTQSTPLLLKVLCDPCKLNYVRDKRSVSRKKIKPEKQQREINSENDPFDNNNKTINNNNTVNSISKVPAKKKQKLQVSRNFQTNLTVKIKLLSATTTTTFTNNTNDSNIVPFNYPLPLTPPPTDDLISSSTKCSPPSLLPSSELDDITILIDNTNSNNDDEDVLFDIEVPDVSIYEYLDEKRIDWCRYCGVAGDTGTFWKLGPWGDRSLCHKHGCEFFGCGFARVTKTRLDLTEFYGEKRAERRIPVITEFCSICWKRTTENEEDEENDQNSKLITCHGCPLSFHRSCLNNSPNHHAHDSLIDFENQTDSHFFCTEKCIENFGKCLIRPQFPSKSNFPFYRQILSLPQDQLNENLTPSSIENVKLKINVKQQELTEQQQKESHNFARKRRKYHRKQQNENQSDRVIAFLPIKVDHSVHLHENIKTPQWTKSSLNERMERLETIILNSESITKSEDLDDTILMERHSRYEHVEKTTRLLKPGVLKQLISGQM